MSYGRGLAGAWSPDQERAQRSSFASYARLGEAEAQPLDLGASEGYRGRVVFLSEDLGVSYCRAAELYGMGTMIKLDQDPRLFMAQRAIGSGFQSVLFVDCRTVEEVQECVRICRPDTPADGGLYGAAGRRFAYTGGDREEFVQALRDVVVAIMVEKAALVEQLEETLAVPGVDMIQWGPADYTMSSGLYTQRNYAAQVKKVERQVEKSAAAMLLEARIGDQFDAIVTGASKKGTWVRLLHPPIEGRLERGFEGLDIGNRLRVQLISTDVERRFIDFTRVT